MVCELEVISKPINIDSIESRCHQTSPNESCRDIWKMEHDIFKKLF